MKINKKDSSGKICYKDLGQGQFFIAVDDDFLCLKTVTGNVSFEGNTAYHYSQSDGETYDPDQVVMVVDGEINWSYK